MEEMESPVEHLHEELHHEAEHGKERWLKWSAILSAVLAVLAAISGMQAGHEINEAMIQQIKASDSWSYYQAKGIKSMMLEVTAAPSADTTQRIEKYKAEQEDIKKDAEAKAEISELHLKGHEVLARSVTLFQIAIVLTAIAVLTRRKRFLLVSAGFGVAGCVFLAQYFMLAGVSLQ